MKYAAIVVACLIVVLGAVLAWSLRDENPHDFDGRCETCHLTQPGEGQVKLFVQSIDALCRRCHEIMATNSHPTQVFPITSVPEEFSLNYQGMMTCATCHDPHLINVDNNDHLLRSEARGAKFCTRCHSESTALYAEHKTLAGLVHHKSWTPPDPKSQDGLLDAVSQACVDCHDDAVQKPASFSANHSSALIYQGRYFSHPIAIDYAAAVQGNLHMRSLDDLSPYISLIEGKIGCLSCHSIFSKKSALLVFANRGSALCLECHMK